jgi:hypothetical protein
MRNIIYAYKELIRTALNNYYLCIGISRTGRGYEVQNKSSCRIDCEQMQKYLVKISKTVFWFKS